MKEIFKKINKSTVGLILIVGALLVGVFFYENKTQPPPQKTLTAQEAAQKAIDYLNQNMLSGETKASLVGTIEESGMYKVHFKVEEQEYDSYVTKDGKYLFFQGIDLTKKPETPEETPASQEVPKSDKPDVKLFVMSYCPYGLQAEKMFLPVYNLLKDKAEMGVYFVNYIMHEKIELDENLRQYCIQKEEKYYDYLNCFVKEGKFEECLSQVKIDNAKLNTCTSETDKKYNITQNYDDESSWLNGSFPKFDVHADLNEKYEVRGSPTIVINDKVVDVSPRSPEKLRQTICQAFNSPPPECDQTLSDTVPSSGFGSGSGTSSGGQCE